MTLIVGSIFGRTSFKEVSIVFFDAISAVIRNIDSERGKIIKIAVMDMITICIIFVPFPLSDLAENPYIKKNNNQAKIIAIRFAKKRRNVQLTTCQSIKYSQIPVAHKGGSKEAAIAAPTIVQESFLNPITKNAINQEANATHKSSKVGVVLASISFVRELKGTIAVKRKAVKKERKILINKYLIERRYKPILHVANANGIHWIGCNKGEISIAPITEGIEFASNQNVAIIIAQNNCIQYKISISNPSITIWETRFFCSSVRRKKRSVAER